MTHIHNSADSTLSLSLISLSLSLLFVQLADWLSPCRPIISIYHRYYSLRCSGILSEAPKSSNRKVDSRLEIAERKYRERWKRKRLLMTCVNFYSRFSNRLLMLGVRAAAYCAMFTSVMYHYYIPIEFKTTRVARDAILILDAYNRHYTSQSQTVSIFWLYNIRSLLSYYSGITFLY